MLCLLGGGAADQVEGVVVAVCPVEGFGAFNGDAVDGVAHLVDLEGGGAGGELEGGGFVLSEVCGADPAGGGDGAVAVFFELFGQGDGGVWFEGGEGFFAEVGFFVGDGRAVGEAEAGDAEDAGS